MPYLTPDLTAGLSNSSQPLLVYPSWRMQMHVTCLILIAITLPYYIYLSNVCILLLGLNWLLDQNILQKLRLTFSQPLFYLFITFFLLQVAGILYSEDVASANKVIEKKLSILVLPLILASSPRLTTAQFYLITSAFALTCLVAAVASCMAILGKHWYHPGSVTFTMTDFTEVIGLNHPYFGMYVVFAMACMVALLHLRLFSYTTRQKIAGLLAIGFLYIFLLFIGARTAFITSLLLIICYGGILLYTQKRTWLIFALVTAFAGSITLLYWLNEPLRERVSLLFSSDLAHNPLYIKSLTWVCGWEIVTDHFLWGVGTGDARPFLQACYLEKNFWGYEQGYNVHNDYLEEAVRHGIIGLLVFLLMLIIPAYYSFKQRQPLYLAFLFIFAMSCLSESVTGTQKGVVFYAFFNALFAFHFLDRQPVSNLSKLNSHA